MTSSSLVKVKEAELITPSELTPSRILSLSSLDSQLFLRFTIEYLLVYSPSSSSQKSALVSSLKSALAEALVPYYPLAGRVRAKPGGLGLEVVCRAQGAVFIEAISDHLLASELVQAPRHVMQWRKLLALHVTDVLKGDLAPPLVMQLTWLADGAAAVGVGLSHCLCDGIGSAEFPNLFSELASGHHGPERPKPIPVWDRHLLDSSPPRASSVNHPEFNRVPDLCNFNSRFTQDRLTPTSVCFTRKSLKELKRIAGPTGRPSELNNYTSFEVLSAHVWRSWARAQNLPSNQILKLLFSVNIRNRVKPSLPTGFYGNGFVLSCAQTTVKDMTEKGLAYVALLVKKAKDRVNDEFVRSAVTRVSESRACPDSVGVLIISQWSRLGLDRVDFGLGRPIHVGPVCCDRYCLFLPVYDETDAVKVMVAVPSFGVEKYQNLVRSPYS
ncbi:hypothetical protein RJ641_035880 [Dillenia turbinata]|uniref:Uncharacterized protein n=1 Tax=Dillenia turbinata TaxID=194707 RepID=A0AAN8ZCC4_9MAGN